MKIHHEAFLSGGYSNDGGAPPPYQPSFDSYGSRLGSHAASPYGISQCPVHRLQGCSCALNQCAREVSRIKFFQCEKQRAFLLPRIQSRIIIFQKRKKSI